MNQKEMFGQAKWIGCDDDIYTPYIRASFQAPDNAAGKITICGLGYFELYINGQRISDDLFVPVTSDYVKRPIIAKGKPFDEEMGHRCYVLQYDISHAVCAGENQLAVALGPGFFATPIDHHDAVVAFGNVRLCYKIDLVGTDGRNIEVVSDENARWTQGNVLESYFFRGEEHDLRIVEGNWTCAEYSAWKPVRILNDMETEYFLQDCPGDKIIRCIEAKLIGEYADCKVYDAGQNLTGWVVLKDEGKTGDRVQVVLSEELNDEGKPDEKYMHGQYFNWTSDGKGKQVHPRFTWHAFRYFAVSGMASVDHIAVIHSDLPKCCAFETDNKVMNWIHDTFIHTLLCNSHGGIPSDCPHLERRGYTGDGQLTMEAALLTLNHHDFVRKWMRDIADCQDRYTGHVQYTAPYTHCGGGPGGWGSAIVSVPYQYYMHYGETSHLRAMYPQMKEYIRYMIDHSKDGLVISDREGDWCLGDWCCPGGVKIPEPFVNNYFLIRSIDMIRKIEDVIGISYDERLPQYRKAASEAILREYYDENTGDFCQGIQGANAFALDIGLGDARTIENLISTYDLLGKYDTGIFGTDIVTRVLFENSAGRVAYKLLNDEQQAAFAGWMHAGATTFWEYWPCDWQRSLNHPMFGAVVSSLYKYVLGIRQEKDSSGWDRVIIEPMLMDLVKHAKGYVTTRHGRISVVYETVDDCVHMDVEVPVGTKAVLRYRRSSLSLEEGMNHLVL